MQITHDKKLLIATGRSRKAAQWQNREMLWSEFLDKLARPTRTRETVAEYAAMGKASATTSRTPAGSWAAISKTAGAAMRAWSTAAWCAWTRTTPTPSSWTIWT